MVDSRMEAKMPRRKEEVLRTAGSRGRLHASQCGSEIRLAFRQGKHGVWRKFVLAFDAADCRLEGTTGSEREVKSWVNESGR
jgi:hypothetical protein